MPTTWLRSLSGSRSTSRMLSPYDVGGTCDSRDNPELLAGTLCSRIHQVEGLLVPLLYAQPRGIEHTQPCQKAQEVSDSLAWIEACRIALCPPRGTESGRQPRQHSPQHQACGSRPSTAQGLPWYAHHRPTRTQGVTLHHVHFNLDLNSRPRDAVESSPMLDVLHEDSV